MNSITDTEFGHFQRFIYEAAGISLSPAKKALVCGRLSKRLVAHQLNSYSAYFKLLASGSAPTEVQTAVDLLTTNETYFFREPKHFELLREVAMAYATRRTGQPFRVWSAASSTGEECYSIAMVLADCLGGTTWDVVGSDISSRVLQRARAGHYSLERTRLIPPAYLKRFCLRGHGEQEGTLLVDRELRSRVTFSHVNLNTELPRLGSFDVIFLRNVMIYFNSDTKRQVVARVLSLLKPGGFFCIGHSESLNDITTAVQQIAPSIYRKP
ncbi:CheR family methyltransferase [Roseateles cellulosilyticus]|uniref:Chemotaxis protein methyltransferase n=1 Tax=Pelomonas cellulosilytica TaxID=2906762 RepID=A0ABS8XYR4_9BURK|nr:protein-glutamate O-methyltransferase CheR [Pelomonas sp. P8]MCE4557771.1 protein-glutamate O-methyltransferase CheR [Pelomonas sp. P8]